MPRVRQRTRYITLLELRFGERLPQHVTRIATRAVTMRVYQLCAWRRIGPPATFMVDFGSAQVRYGIVRSERVHRDLRKEEARYEPHITHCADLSGNSYIVCGRIAHIRAAASSG